MKWRVAYTKTGKIRFLGHLDMARVWERALRRVEVPVSMSTGFTPRPKLSFGLALPTGAESLVELLDVVVDDSFGFGPDVLATISDALPDGVEVIEARPSANGVSLQEDVVATTWVMALDAPDVLDSVDRLAESTEFFLERERKGERRRDDIRPGILHLAGCRDDEARRLSSLGWRAEGVLVTATLTTSGRGIRPTELVEALAPGVEPWVTMKRVIRTHQWINDAGRHVDVLTGEPGLESLATVIA